jgi:phosphoglycolate phosphatase-like HAD superfamily hydrolase
MKMESNLAAGPFQGIVEWLTNAEPRTDVQHAVFDFDGTISLIREGWPEVMVPMMLEYLPSVDGETDEARRTLVYDDIMRLNGKQTIYQMMQFADRVRERGGLPEDPLWYKKEYLRRLDIRIQSRQEDLKSGAAESERYLVFGVVALLEFLVERGIQLYLASGTDEIYVRKEAELLGVTKFFGSHIYGAQDDYKKFSKKMVIERILRENSISGAQLIAFGDGYVEIENTKEVGGYAVAVASDEANNGSGNVDLWKRNRLASVGADVVIPDYRDYLPLMNRILGR